MNQWDIIIVHTSHRIQKEQILNIRIWLIIVYQNWRIACNKLTQQCLHVNGMETESREKVRAQIGT